MQLRYNACIFCNRNSPARTQVATLGFSVPAISGDLMTWASPNMGFEGRWTRREPPAKKRLFTSAQGSVHWDCAMPAASAHVEFKSGRSLEGFGCTEHMHLSIVPWRMPVRVVRSGHFIAEHRSAVWMNWTGQSAIQAAYIDGHDVGLMDTDETCVQFNEGFIELSRSKILREGYLADTVFRSVPDIENLVPRPILDVEDHKWLSAATLHCPGRPDVTGWAIHEYAVWPEMSEDDM